MLAYNSIEYKRSFHIRESHTLTKSDFQFRLSAKAKSSIYVHQKSYTAAGLSKNKFAIEDNIRICIFYFITYYKRIQLRQKITSNLKSKYSKFCINDCYNEEKRRKQKTITKVTFVLFTKESGFLLTRVKGTNYINTTKAYYLEVKNKWDVFATDCQLVNWKLTRQANESSTSILYVHISNIFTMLEPQNQANVQHPNPAQCGLLSGQNQAGSAHEHFYCSSDAVLAPGSTHFPQLVEVDGSLQFIITSFAFPNSQITFLCLQSSDICHQKAELRGAVHFRTAEAELWQ